jgi:hypothetical protein
VVEVGNEYLAAARRRSEEGKSASQNSYRAAPLRRRVSFLLPPRWAVGEFVAKLRPA